MFRKRSVVLSIAVFSLIGCKHIGPGNIIEDRLPYNEAVAYSWKQQTLLNIVRLRYSDVPEFIDVPSIVAGYGLDRTTVGTFGISSNSGVNGGLGETLGLSRSRTLSDRPTITFSPQSGSAFTRNLINPLPTVSILNLIESGNPADVILDLGVESVNGIRNRQFVGNKIQEADPEFHLIGEILKKAQASGDVSLRVTPSKDKNDPGVLMTIRSKDMTPELSNDLSQLRKMLRLDPNLNEFKIVSGMLPQANDEIAFRTRSVIRMLTYLSLNVQVPECHLAEGRAPNFGSALSQADPQITVRCGCKKPCDSYATVYYQGHWFWIDHYDFNSKRTMNYLKILLALADTAPKEAAPQLTIRAN